MERMIDSRAVAEALDLHPATVRRLAVRGLIPAVRVGGVWRFSPADVQAALRREARP